jgi:mono/diheme cytochrome c family protein
MRVTTVFSAIAALAWAAFCAAAIAANAPTKPGIQRRVDKEIERGRYLVAISACNDCHTPGYLATGGKTPEKDWLIGSATGWRGSWGTTYPTNLRLYFQEISEAQWVQLAKEMRRRPPMPYFSLNAMSEGDVRAIFKYIRSLGPAGQPAPKFVPPGEVPQQPYVQFPDALN